MLKILSLIVLFFSVNLKTTSIEEEKFNELVNFVDSLRMKHGSDYSCKKISFF